MTPGEHQPERGAPALALQVDRDNVLQARALLLQEADRLDLALNRAIAGIERVERCGGDPVSADAVLAFPERMMALFESCRAHNRQLRDSAEALAAVARTYGFTEVEIAAGIPTMGPVAIALSVRSVIDRAH